MSEDPFPQEAPIIQEAQIVRDDTYSAQREEMLEQLKACLDRNDSLDVHGRRRLIPDEIYVILHKIKHAQPFSRKERSALEDAGFLLEKLYPDL